MTNDTTTPEQDASVLADRRVRDTGSWAPLAPAFTRPGRLVIPRGAAGLILSWGATLAISAFVAAILLFHLDGGRWFFVETPSMGTAAPVGTLILSTPTTVANLEVGDVISFVPPNSTDKTYTHRIVDITADGLISTRGDVNGATDPWQLTDANLVGKVTTILPGLGWLIRALPILMAGFGVLWLITFRMRNRTNRAAFRIAGSSLVFSIAAFILKPFTGVVIEETSVDGGSPTATVVSTGLLPIRVQAAGGTHTDLTSGQLGHVSFPESVQQSFFTISTGLHLGPLGWTALIIACCLPLIWTLTFGLPGKTTESPA